MSAIIFDLDDTLYPRRRWVLSGFAAVARHLEVACGLERGDVFRLLAGALRAGDGRHALQRLCARHGLSDALIPGWVKLMRSHRPRLRLPVATRWALTALRGEWRLAVLTNGPRPVQARKAAALRLAEQVDQIVYAADYGEKPEPLPFLAVAARLGVVPPDCVFVGDDLWRDVHGARRVGMRTVRVRRSGRSPTVSDEPEADAVIDDLRALPGAVSRLISS